MALLYGRAGRLTAKNGVFRPGQMEVLANIQGEPSGPGADSTSSLVAQIETLQAEEDSLKAQLESLHAQLDDAAGASSDEETLREHGSGVALTPGRANSRRATGGLEAGYGDAGSPASDADSTPLLDDFLAGIEDIADEHTSAEPTNRSLIGALNANPSSAHPAAADAADAAHYTHGVRTVTVSTVAATTVGENVETEREKEARKKQQKVIRQQEWRKLKRGLKPNDPDAASGGAAVQQAAPAARAPQYPPERAETAAAPGAGATADAAWDPWTDI